MTQEEIKKKYQNLHLRYSTERDILTHRIRKYALFRITSFLLLLVAIYLSTSWSWTAFGVVMITGSLIFGYLVWKHNLLYRRMAIVEHLLRINREEEFAMEWNYSNFQDGDEFVNKGHHFSYDLDLFGKGSLFQYINRTSTIPGKDRLAVLLSYVEKSKLEIVGRQEAIAELAPLFEWRQDFRVLGLMAEEHPEDISGLKEWVNTLPDFKSPFFRVLIIAVPIITLIVFILSVLGVISFWLFLAYLCIPLMLAGIKHRRVNVKHNLLSRKYTVLKKFSALFRLIEKEQFTSERMQRIREELIPDGLNASEAIRKLARISNAFDTRLNLLAGFLMNVLLLWDIRQSVRLEAWQKKYRERLPEWFRVMGETDAYISLAGYSYNNPDFIFPEISETDELLLEAQMMGHPLIHSRKRVCNNYHVTGWKNFTILTGANMAGKSTFLRTVGINILLASCGAPVCAKKFVITPVELLTSIHTFDSLANNESYFYAELKRLKMLIDMLEEGKKIFIILDEILKGTNSRDKQSGSKALVKQLISLEAAGIIATHDLSLGELEKYFPLNIQNRCFEVNINKDQLSYDYTLTEGIAQNMNATILMERMGITVE